MNRLEELALVARCVAYDDRRAFARLVDATSEPLLRFLSGMTGNDSLAADLAQETYIKAWRGLRGWMRTGRFTTWLFAIALNEFRSHVRSLHPAAETLSPETLRSCGAADTVSALDAGMDLRTALRLLPEMQRAAVLLYYYRDMPVKRIARILQMPEGTVKSHLSRARQALKKIIES